MDEFTLHRQIAELKVVLESANPSQRRCLQAEIRVLEYYAEHFAQLQKKHEKHEKHESHEQ